ncbi:MAG: hypothetical protein JWM34_3934 [Ilumatobacteraceae bacterium]|nr:hypothetical protein [Ilumatobacteraceae bacterium]
MIVPRTRSVTLVMTLVASVLSLSLLAVSTAHAAAQWNDGVTKYSTVVNCPSQIQNAPYTESGAAAYVGFIGNTSTGEPYPGEVYYVHVVVYGLGNPCSGQRAQVEFTPPSNTTPAISAANKVYCFADGHSDPAECPQTLGAGSFGGAYWIPAPTAQPGRSWPLPQGHSWEFQIPVVSSTSFTNGTMHGYVTLADGNASPTLQPTSFVGVYAKTPEVVSPSVTTFTVANWPATQTSTTVKTVGTVNPYGVGGSTWFDLLTGPGGSVTYADGPAPVAAGSTGPWSTTENWVLPGHPLVASHAYYFRVRYVTSAGTTITGPQQSFTTPPSSGGTTTTAPSTTTTTPPTIPGGGSGSPGSGTTPTTTPYTTTTVATPTTTPATSAPTTPATSAPTTTVAGSTTTTTPDQASSPGTGSSSDGASGYVPIVPSRLLDTRTDPASTTLDGLAVGHGIVAGGDTIQLQVTGRAGVPPDAGAAVLNVTVTGALGNGYVTVYPCGAPRPTTSNLNFTAGQTIPNAVIAKIGDSGKVCIYTNVGTHLLADINGYFPAGSSYTPIVPGRILDTRQDPNSTTIDGQGLAHGVVSGGDTIEVQVTGRAGVPTTAGAAVLNVTVTGSLGNGYVTVYPCGADRPTTSNLNFAEGQTIPDAVVSKIGVAGAVCLYANVGTHVLVDTDGYFSS